MKTESLQNIGLKYQTDKADINHTFNGQTYLDIYDDIFSKFRYDNNCILEIGVLEGRSLQMWREYFPNSSIWGLDINPAANKYYGDNINVIVGNQADEISINEIAPKQQFDVVIDDGSHLIDHIIKSYELLWNRVKCGGYYVIEDLGCTYGDVTPNIKIWPGMTLNPIGTNFNNKREVLNDFFLDKIHSMDAKTGNIRSITFFSYMCFIKKV